MQEAKVLAVEYVKPEKVLPERDWKEVRKYLKQGYFIERRENGNCFLKRKSQIFVTLKCNGEVRRVEFRQVLEKYYGYRGGYILAELFKEDLNNSNSIGVVKDSRGYRIIS